MKLIRDTLCKWNKPLLLVGSSFNGRSYVRLAYRFRIERISLSGRRLCRNRNTILGLRLREQIDGRWVDLTWGRTPSGVYNARDEIHKENIVVEIALQLCDTVKRALIAENGQFPLSVN